MLVYFRLCFLLVFHAISYNVCCQSASPATDSIYEKALGQAIQGYADSLKQALQVYNGIEYTARYTSNKGTPFLKVDTFTKGKVCSNGVVYYGIEINYDAVADQLVIFNPYQKILVIPHKHFVQWFEMENVKYENLQLERWPGLGNPGFYEVLSSGNVMAYAKRNKTSAGNATLYELSDFESFSTFHILSKGTFVNINSKSDLMNACNPFQKEVGDFYKKEKLRYSKNTAATISSVINYLNTLSNK